MSSCQAKNMLFELLSSDATLQQVVMMACLENAALLIHGKSSGQQLVIEPLNAPSAIMHPSLYFSANP